MDEEKRAAMYTDAQRILVDDVGGVFLFYRKVAALMKPWLKGMKRTNVGDCSGTNDCRTILVDAQNYNEHRDEIRILVSTND